VNSLSKTSTLARLLVEFSAVLFLPAGSVLAYEDPLYHLSRIGLMSIADDNAKNQQIVGVVLGLRVGYSNYVEVEFNLPIGGGSYNNSAGHGSYDIEGLALYSVYRYVFSPDYYIKIKAGIGYTSISNTDKNLNIEIISTDSGVAGGLGLGIVYNINSHPVMLEIEMTVVAQELTLYSLGITYPF